MCTEEVSLNATQEDSRNSEWPRNYIQHYNLFAGHKDSGAQALIIMAAGPQTTRPAVTDKMTLCETGTGSGW
jgi:hypothetical protein